MKIADEIVVNYVNGIENEEHKKIFIGVLEWIQDTYPELSLVFKYKTPMFILKEPKETFILGLNSAKKHFGLAPEGYYMVKFADKIKDSGYDYSLKLIKIKYKEEINYNFLKDLIDFKIEDKFGSETFWK